MAVTLNERANRLADYIAANVAASRIDVAQTAGACASSTAASRWTAACRPASGWARLPRGTGRNYAGAGFQCRPAVSPGAGTSDNPVLGCMASQYAGWQIAVGKYFAMGSGPMRAALGTEELFDHIEGREQPPVAVGVLETRKLPTEEVVGLSDGCSKLPAAKLTLLAAPAFSLAGNLQVVARSLETALHKLYELQFDLGQVVSGFGVAPLPPVASDDLAAIGRTNDAILYGGRVVLWVKADDDRSRATIGPKVPSSSSPDHGAPFAEVFKRYGMDFYKIDPLLFSPAMVSFHNLQTGKSHTFGRIAGPDVLRRSFFGEA